MSPTNVLNTNSDENCNHLLRHTLLLLLLCISMLVGAALCIRTIFMDKVSGIYLDLVFLDAFLNLGQAIFILALFGGIFIPLCYYTRKLLYEREQIVPHPWKYLVSVFFFFIFGAAALFTTNFIICYTSVSSFNCKNYMSSSKSSTTSDKSLSSQLLLQECTDQCQAFQEIKIIQQQTRIVSKYFAELCRNLSYQSRKYKLIPVLWFTK